MQTRGSLHIVYAVNVSVNNAAYGTATPASMNVIEGNQITISATPSVGYEFIEWQGDSTGSTNPAQITVNSDMNITAVFQISYYSLTTVSEYGEINRDADETLYSYGTIVSLTAVPADGYNFLRWEGDFDGDSAIENPVAVTMNADKTVTAIFTNLPFFTVTTTIPDGNGTVSPNPVNVTEGEDMTLTATPDSGYRFIEWLDADDGDAQIGTSASLTLSAIASDRNIEAVFELIPIYTVTTAITPAGSGTVSPNPVDVEEGENITLTATPSSGFKSVRWLDESDVQIGTSNTLTLSNITSARNITAEFIPEQWTILVHFAVDNNIDYDFESSMGIVSNYLATLESIEAGDTNNNIDIIVLMDCYNEDTQGTGYATIFQDGYYHLTGGSFADDIDVTITEVNSGSVADTQNFMDWVVTNYPADNYMYSIFNHGGGFDDQNIAGTYSAPITLGIGFDDSHDDSLSHYELGQTTAYLKGLIGKNIDLFYTYACLMGGVELAYEVRNSADYMLFSEELYPADFWSYEALSAITSIPGLSGKELGIAFCDDAYDYFTTDSIRAFTLSLIDLSTIDSLYSSINTYAQAAVSNIGNNATQADHYNSAAIDAFSMYGGEWYYMDLGDYLSNINADSNISSTVKNAGSNVTTALNNSVVYKTQSGYPDATGMTIFHNIWNSPIQYPISTYESILTFGANRWVDYLTTIENLIILPVPDIYEPDDDPADANEIIVDATPQNHTLHSVDDIDTLYFHATAGQTYTIQATASGDILDMYLFEEGDYINSIGYGFVGQNINFSCTTTGIYGIGIVSFGGVGEYAIGIEASATPPGDSFEPDGTFGDADTSILIDGATQDHTIHISGDQDYIQFELIAGTDYKIETYSNGGDFVDTVLYLYDTAQGEIGYNDDSNGLYSAITYACLSSGTYYAMVEDFSGSNTGDYAIDIQSGTFTLESNFDRNKTRSIK
jgi:hypothetical protein